MQEGCRREGQVDDRKVKILTGVWLVGLFNSRQHRRSKWRSERLWSKRIVRKVEARVVYSWPTFPIVEYIFWVKATVGTAMSIHKPSKRLSWGQKRLLAGRIRDLTKVVGIISPTHPTHPTPTNTALSLQGIFPPTQIVLKHSPPYLHLVQKKRKPKCGTLCVFSLFDFVGPF